MKKLTTVLLCALMIVSLAVVASAYWEPEEAFGEVKFTIGKQTTAWNADGKISDGEYYKVDIDPTWISYAINDNDTDAGLEYAKSVTPELYMSWDETNIYCATVYTVTKGHENLWDGDPASMWYSGAVQFNYANFDEVASEYRLEYGVGLSSDTGDILYTVWADGAGTGFTPSEENAKVWLDGNTLTYETKVAWEDFADEDNTAGKEGLGFNFCLVWSIGEGQDYVHIQLAEGCTGNGKHAENFAQVTLGPAQEAASASSAGSKGENAFEEIWVTADQEFYDDPETLFEGGSGQPIQYVEGYGVGYSSLNDQVIFRDIDFGANGADKMLINFSNGGGDNTTLAIYIDEKSGDPDATYTIPNTGGWEAVWAEDFETPIDVKSGVHDVIIEFTNSNSGSFYYIKFFEKAAGAAAPAAAPAAGEDSAAKMFTDFDSYASFEVGGDPVYAMDDAADVADYWTGNWDSMGDNGDELTVEIRDGIGYNGTKGLALSSSGNTNVGLYLYATDKNGIAKSYPGANYLRVWMDLTNVGFRKANFGVVNSLACLFSTDEVDAAWDCPFWYSPDGANWTEMAHGGDGCFGDAQDSDVFGFKGWFAFPLKDFTIRGNANWEAYDELTPCDPADVWGVYLFWDYSDNYIDEQGNPFILDNIEFVGDYKVFTYDVTGSGAAAEAAPAEEAPAEEAPAEEAPAAATYPASGADGSIITGTVIGNETGWGDNAAAGAAAAFDGDAATFFDPLGVGDGFCGIDAGESYILDKVVILSRDGWNDRFVGAMIQGSNDGENWTTLWTSGETGTNPDYYTVTEFENNTGYSQFRYFNETNHGDVAEVEFYGQAGVAAAELPGFATADEAVASIGKTAIGGYEFVTGAEGAFGGEGPENLWDGSVDTKLCTNTLPASSTAKLDGEYAIDGVTIALANDNAAYGRIPTEWTLSGSTDGENWEVITTGDDSLFVKDNGDYRYFAKSFDATPAYSYVKIDITGSTDDIVQISEVVLTGAKAAAAPDAALDQKAEAPNTFDFGIIAAVAAVVSLGGFALTKKKH